MQWRLNSTPDEKIVQTHSYYNNFCALTTSIFCYFCLGPFYNPSNHGTVNILNPILFVRQASFHKVSKTRKLVIICRGVKIIHPYLKSRCCYNRTGYDKHVKKYTSPAQLSSAIKRNEAGADGVDLEGKVVVITGANSGIGKELATYAASKGAKLYMLCRSKERAEQVRDEIIKLTSNENIEIVLADLAELAQVRQAATSLAEKESKIDVLVCNGGVLLNDRRESSDGYELTFASHLLGGSYLLSSLLVPQIQAAEDQGRVIFVSSGGMYNTKFPEWNTAISSKDSPQTYNGNFAYAYAKRGQVLLAERFTKTIPEISWVSVHPGWSLTNAVDEAYGESKKYLEPFRTPWEGAEGIAWLMSTKKSNIESGAFYLDRKPQQKHLAGAFFSEGSFTKNTEDEVDEMMNKLKEAAGL